MFKSLSILFLCAALYAPPAFAQGASSQDFSASGPVAYIYVSSAPRKPNPDAVFGFAAAANGALTPIPNSPLGLNESLIASSPTTVVGFNAHTLSFDSFQIASDGSLSYASSISCVQNDYGCESVYTMTFDNAGADLYVNEQFAGSGYSTNSFSVDGSSGSLTYLGVLLALWDNSNISFMHNDVLAFSFDQISCAYDSLDEFRRQSNGMLVLTQSHFQQPIPPPNVSLYYADIAAADPAGNYVAMVEQPVNPPYDCDAGYPVQIAAYTVESNGDLNTNSTYQNMPSTPIIDPQDMKISPSGKLLAVGGEEGLQIFRFNGSQPVTHYTGLLTTDPVTQLFWDNSDHLYALSRGGLYVLTVTPDSITNAPGSPHSIAFLQGLAVQPLVH